MDKFITFMSKGQIFALAINYVEKITLYDKTIAIPDTSDYITGYNSYEGKSLPLIDLNQRFFNQPTKVDENTKVVVVHWEEHLIGLIVEEVTSIKEFSEVTTTEEDEMNESYIVDTIHDGENIILQVAIEKMFTEEKAITELHRLLK